MLDTKSLLGLREGLRYLRTGSSICNFATVSWCNARCVFCSYPSSKTKQEVNLHDGERAVDALSELDVGILSLTGGEPFLNRDLAAIAGYAVERGMTVFTGTNGTLLTEERVAQIANAGIKAIWISYEAPEARIFDQNRGVPGLSEKIRTGLRDLRDAGVNTFCICVINRTITDYRTFIGHIASLGYDKVKFDYPMMQLDSSYLGFADQRMLKLSAEEMRDAVSQILALKRERHLGVEILNPTEGLEGAVRHWSGERPRYPCFAGEKVVYLDWNLDLWRCTRLPERFGKVWEVRRDQLKRIDCDLCYYQGVRDYDSLFQLVGAVEQSAAQFQGGHLFESARSLFDPHNLGGLRSLIELGTSGIS